MVDSDFCITSGRTSDLPSAGFDPHTDPALSCAAFGTVAEVCQNAFRVEVPHEADGVVVFGLGSDFNRYRTYRLTMALSDVRRLDCLLKCMMAFSLHLSGRCLQIGGAFGAVELGRSRRYN
jgi:hypothetical protein